VNAFTAFGKSADMILRKLSFTKESALSLLCFFAVVGVMFIFSSYTAHAKTILMLGDSLTAGYNLPAQAALPAVIERKLKDEAYSVTFINGGVSGDTAAQGLARLDWMLSQKVDGVIIALGANDMLRGFPPAQTKRDLELIIAQVKAKKIPVMLVGMKATPSLGGEFVRAYDGLFPELAARENLIIYPFMLEGVAGNASLIQADGLHPTAKGVETMAQNMLPSVKMFIKNRLQTDLPTP
jgi:acyl-CoA thioesterase I